MCLAQHDRTPPLTPDPCSIRLTQFRLCDFALELTSPLALSHGQQLTHRHGTLIVLGGQGTPLPSPSSAPLPCSLNNPPLPTPAGATPAPSPAPPSVAGTAEGIGELCVLPGFHEETQEEARQQLAAVAAALRGRVVPPELAALGGALAPWDAHPPPGCMHGLRMQLGYASMASVWRGGHWEMHGRYMASACCGGSVGYAPRPSVQTPLTTTRHPPARPSSLSPFLPPFLPPPPPPPPPTRPLPPALPLPPCHSHPPTRSFPTSH